MLIIVALLSILYVWYMSKTINNYPDDKILDLSNNNDSILSKWYESTIQIIYQYDNDESEIAAEYLHNVYDLEVDPKLIVIGENLNSQYKKLTRKELPKNCIFDLRSSLGIPGEIAIINNDKIRNILIRNNNYDIKLLYEIVKSKVDKIAHDALQEILKYRWSQITETLDIKGFGSYLYLENDTEEIFPGVLSKITEEGCRINLLCTDLEFNTFLKRSKYKSLSI